MRGDFRYDAPLVNTAALRTLMIYAVILPLAVFIGWLVSGDMTQTSFGMLAGIIFVLLMPLLLKWHYPVMVFSWSTFITIFFLPGQPALWMVMAGLNFGIAILNRIMSKRQAFLPAPSITMALVALVAVVFITAQLTGGMGMRILGGSGSQGGKAYYFIFAAVIGYFALASQPIRPDQAKFYMTLFFLPGIIAAGSNLIYFAGPAFYFLFLIVPVGFAAVQAASDSVGSISRLGGFASAATAAGLYLLAISGVRELLTRWWKLLLFLLLMGLGAMGGYRSTILSMGLLFLILFFLERLHRTPLLPTFALAGALAFCLMLPFTEQLPRSIQRTLSFLPIKVDPNVLAEAQGSWEWRVHMWEALLPDLPKYFWLGKGYSMNPTDLYLTQQAMRYGRSPDYANDLIVGNYHSGPLSIYIPFGVFGTITFVAFLGLALRALYRNYRYGRDELKFYNRFLFGYFLSRTIFFMVAFGSFHSELYIFTGIMGLSVALNHGVCRQPVLVQRPVVFRGRMEFAARSKAA